MVYFVGPPKRQIPGQVASVIIAVIWVILVEHVSPGSSLRLRYTAVYVIARKTIPGIPRRRAHEICGLPRPDLSAPRAAFRITRVEEERLPCEMWQIRPQCVVRAYTRQQSQKSACLLATCDSPRSDEYPSQSQGITTNGRVESKIRRRANARMQTWNAQLLEFRSHTAPDWSQRA